MTLRPANRLSANDARRLFGQHQGHRKARASVRLDQNNGAQPIELRPSPAAGPRPRKYRNVPTWYDSPHAGLRKYDSKAEANYARLLDEQLTAGAIRFWMPQVPLDLGWDAGSGAPQRMVVDFKVWLADGSVVYRDTKGAAPTRDWLLKQNAVRQHLGIEVETIATGRRRKRGGGAA